MKLALVVLVSLLAVAQASACPYPDAHSEPVEERDRSWIVWLSLLGVAAAASGIAVRPRVSE